jgi:hypothetical protein
VGNPLGKRPVGRLGRKREHNIKVDLREMAARMRGWCTTIVCKVRGLTLLLRVGTLWRCGDGLFFEVSPLASDSFVTTLHSLLENVLQTVDHFEISCLGALFSWLEKPRNRMGRDLN